MKKIFGLYFFLLWTAEIACLPWEPLSQQNVIILRRYKIDVNVLTLNFQPIYHEVHEERIYDEVATQVRVTFNCFERYKY